MYHYFMMTIDQRLWAKTICDVVTGCVLWTGSRTASGGYAQFSLNGKPVRVHRMILERKLRRPLGPGMCALHVCDTPNCIREEHLFEGTRRDNTEDMMAKGRGWPTPKVTEWAPKPLMSINDVAAPTAGEIDALWAYCHTGSQKQAASYLGIGTQTLRNQLASLYRALGVHSFIEAVVLLGWLSLPARPAR